MSFALLGDFLLEVFTVFYPKYNKRSRRRYENVNETENDNTTLSDASARADLELWLLGVLLVTLILLTIIPLIRRIFIRHVPTTKI